SRLADTIVALKSNDEFAVDIVFRAYSEQSALLISLLAEQVRTLKVDIQTHDNSDERFRDFLSSDESSPLMKQLMSESSSNQLLSFNGPIASAFAFESKSIDF
ncbi:hypothetical protein PENTCL1PPCAC_14827, partial [Pristionchus entomophagus]